MKLYEQKKIADIYLFDVETSESELETYQQCMEYILTHLSSKQIEDQFGAYPDEIKGMIEDISEILQASGVYESKDDESARLPKTKAV